LSKLNQLAAVLWAASACLVQAQTIAPDANFLLQIKLPANANDVPISALALPDGSVVVWTKEAQAESERYAHRLQKLTPSGGLDTSFNTVNLPADSIYYTPNSTYSQQQNSASRPRLILTPAGAIQVISMCPNGSNAPELVCQLFSQQGVALTASISLKTPIPVAANAEDRSAYEVLP
jgi:hypothetical protein